MKKIIILSFLLSPVLTSYSQTYSKVSACVIENGELKNISVDYNNQDLEKSLMVGGVRKKFSDVYPLQGKDYAGGQSWFINNEVVTFKDKPYVKYGLPRVLTTIDIKKVGMYKEVGVYVEAGLNGIEQVIYIPSRQGCEFQPYVVNCKDLHIAATGKPTADAMNFTAVIAGEKDKINYVWSSMGLNISKGQGSKIISVDTKNKNPEDEFSLSLYAYTKKDCWLASDTFFVKKPK